MDRPARPPGPVPRRVAMISVHTSPLEQPGTGDAGGLNVYVVEVARRLAGAGTQVDVFTRATRTDQPPVVELVPGVLVRHVPAGPPDPVAKEDLPALTSAFTDGMLAAGRDGFDLLHSHYWLAGQVGVALARRWGLPLVHTMHTMARVKNQQLSDGDAPEPPVRELGEQRIVEKADRLVANTRQESQDLISHYGADPARISVVNPGVDLDVFRPAETGEVAAARGRLGLPAEAAVLLFVGRIQPLKRPDLLLRAVGVLLRRRPQWRGRLLAVVLGGASGARSGGWEELHRLAGELGIAGQVLFRPPVTRPELADWYRAVDLVAMPSQSESFGLVAAEAQACGTPVLAADVGGLRSVIADGESGVLVADHEPDSWAEQILRLIEDPEAMAKMGAMAAQRGWRFSWEQTVAGTFEAYADVLRTRRDG